MNRYNLDALGIHELRDLGHVLGVKSPTTKNSEQLKQAISDLLEGRAEPYIRPNKKGRPIKHNTNSFMKNENFIPSLDKLGQDLSVPYQFQSENYDWVVAMPHAIYSACVEEKLENCNGIVEAIQMSFGLLRQNDCQKRSDDIYISPILMKQHSLKSGDHIFGKCKWLSDDKPKAMVEITSINKNRMYDFESSNICLGQTKTNNYIGDYRLGGRYILTPSEQDNLQTYFDDVCKSFESDGIEVCAIKLGSNAISISNNNDIIHVPFNISDDQVLSVTNLNFDRFKRKMEEGKNIIVVVDSLSKYIKSANAVMTNNAMHQTIAPNTLLSVKQLISIAKCIDENASITLIDIEGEIRPNTIKELFDCEIRPLFNM